MATPYGKDVMGPIVNSFRARGMRAGVYVCPSFWNRDDYFFPNALTSFGTCCQPNYVPSTNTAAWTSFTSYLHEQLAELATLYQPDHYWLDSGTYPPNVDTHIEQVVPQIRAANPTAVVHVRDGGIYHDYAESVDHSEDDAHDILGMRWVIAGLDLTTTSSCRASTTTWQFSIVRIYYTPQSPAASPLFRLPFPSIVPPLQLHPPG